jgi:hypothetical protein
MIHFLLNFFSFFRKKSQPQEPNLILVFSKGWQSPDMIFGNIEKIKLDKNRIFVPTGWKFDYTSESNTLDSDFIEVTNEQKKRIVSYQNDQIANGNACSLPEYWSGDQTGTFTQAERLANIDDDDVNFYRDMSKLLKKMGLKS